MSEGSFLALGFSSENPAAQFAEVLPLCVSVTMCPKQMDQGGSAVVVRDTEFKWLTIKGVSLGYP